jgi:hypothetical protein
MRWLRLLAILFALTLLFLLGAFYSYRAVACKQARVLDAQLATLPDPAAGMLRKLPARGKPDSQK